MSRWSCPTTSSSPCSSFACSSTPSTCGSSAWLQIPRRKEWLKGIKTWKKSKSRMMTRRRKPRLWRKKKRPTLERYQSDQELAPQFRLDRECVNVNVENLNRYIWNYVLSGMKSENWCGNLNGDILILGKFWQIGCDYVLRLETFWETNSAFELSTSKSK